MLRCVTEHVLPAVRKYISAVTSGKYSKPNNVSYEVVRNTCTSDVCQTEVFQLSGKADGTILDIISN